MGRIKSSQNMGRIKSSQDMGKIKTSAISVAIFGAQ